MSDTILNIDSLLMEVERSLQTNDLKGLPTRAPILYEQEGWDSLSPEQQIGKALRMRGVLSEAQRLKQRRSSRPLSKKAQEQYPGDLYWIKSAASYGGTD